MEKSILYIVNFYGTPPLNYFERFLKEEKQAKLTIIKLPAIRTEKGRLTIDAFVKDESNKQIPMMLSFWFPLPYVFMYIAQYLLNIVILFILLQKITRRQFDIGIGETNFGSAMIYLLKKLGRVSYSVYFNGDILPDPASSNQCFFLPNTHSPFHFLVKWADTVLLYFQKLLRKLGYRNDLVWYCNTKIKDWDRSSGLKAKDEIIHDPILLDFKDYQKYAGFKKDMNALCYIGRIDDYVGLDVIIPSLQIVKKKIPQIMLHIIGGSSATAEKYKALTHSLKLDNHVTFYGYLPSADDAFDIMARCALGVALYKPVKENVSMIAQPAKPKEYIKAALPVLVTRGGPEVGDEIVKAHAGVTAEFTVESAADAITTILTNKKIYSMLQKGVEKYARKSHYSSVFMTIWDEILKRLG